MESLLRYSAATVLMIAGFWITAASVIAGNGVHMHASTSLGAAITGVGLAICVGAYILVRHLRGEGVYRNVLNVLLLCGSLSLVGYTVIVGYDWVSGTRPSEGEPNYAFGCLFGVLCLFTLWLLNARLRPRS